MQPSIYRATEANVDGGSTNKYKKNIASMIITSMLAGLTDARRGSNYFSSVSSLALVLVQCLQEKEVPESVNISKRPPRLFFV